MEEHSHIVLVRTLEINDCVEQLAQEGEDTIVLVERLQASEESQQELKVFPFASIERLLGAISNAFHGLHSNFGFNVIAIESNRCDEWDLEGLFDDTAEG